MVSRYLRSLAAAVAGLALAGALSACGGGGTITLTATFDDVGDMVARHSVQLADIRVGEITKIELTDDFRARVTMEVDGSIPIPQDVVPVVGKTSLLGEKFIELRPEGESDEGPFLVDGADLGVGIEAPELEYVAEKAIGLLGAVVSTDIATLIDTGAEGFGGRGADLRRLIDNLGVISQTLADRSQQIGTIIDGLDRATQTLAAGDDDISRLLANLAETTQVLVDNRQKALDALQALSRLAGIQNDLLDRYQTDLDRQIGQVDAILVRVASNSADVERLVTWLDRFITKLPQGIPGDFTQVYMWVVPQPDDPRTNGGGS